MLGKNVKIDILGTLSDCRLYTGYISDIGYDRQIYILSDDRLEETVSCTIIASVSAQDGSDLRYIAAPFHKIFYEPEIRQRLKGYSLCTEKIACIYEKSCGAVIYRRNEKNDVRILLVKNRHGKCWTFPKGHIEAGENERQTALREIKEETGLTVTLEPGFRQTSSYRPFGKIKKTVVFFLAKAEKSVVSMQQNELDYYLWVSVDEALRLCRHKNDTKILIEVKKRLCIKKK